MNGIAYFEIQSSEPSREKVFYEAIFGWKFTRVENIPIEYYQIESPGMFGGLLKRPAKIPSSEQGTNAFVCSVEVESFDKTAEQIIANGGKVALQKFAIPGKCWQGYFIDADNNTFGLFEVDPEAM